MAVMLGKGLVNQIQRNSDGCPHMARWYHDMTALSLGTILFIPSFGFSCIWLYGMFSNGIRGIIATTNFIVYVCIATRKCRPHNRCHIPRLWKFQQPGITIIKQSTVSQITFVYCQLSSIRQLSSTEPCVITKCENIQQVFLISSCNVFPVIYVISRTNSIWQPVTERDLNQWAVWPECRIFIFPIEM